MVSSHWGGLLGIYTVFIFRHPCTVGLPISSGSKARCRTRDEVSQVWECLPVSLSRDGNRPPSTPFPDLPTRLELGGSERSTVVFWGFGGFFFLNYAWP